MLSDAFYDVDESPFYASEVASFARRIDSPPNCLTIHEFGSGSAQAVCDVFGLLPERAQIIGYEIDPTSCQIARAMVSAAGLSDRYLIREEDFFAARDAIKCRSALVANPPYLPISGSTSAFPDLSGGPSGNEVSKQILRSGFGRVLLIMSSFADPLSLFDEAIRLGYRLVYWNSISVPFGQHCNRPNVAAGIHRLAASGRAYVQENRYLVMATEWSLSRDTPDTLGIDGDGDVRATLVSTLRELLRPATA